MTYFILLILGLSVGAIFLTILLIGDWREARQSAEKKALQEDIQRARQPQEGVWPPPPDASALLATSAQAVRAAKQTPPGTSRKMVYTFFRYRNYALGTIFAAYFVYSCYPKLNFGWVLLTTAVGVVLLAAIMAHIQKAHKNRTS